MEAGVVRFSRETHLRVLREGFIAYQSKGVARECPYGGDERNGIWCFGAQGARHQRPFQRVVKDFDRQEGRHGS